jgi:hypothetical protein
VGCTVAQEQTMETPVLARLEVPANAILLYEEMVIGDQDRTGNWRFYIDTTGCVFNVHNQPLFIEEADQQSDDPALFWNAPFPATPARCLNDAQLATLRQLLDEPGIAALEEYYRDEAFARTSSPVIERWVMTTNNQQKVVAIELRKRPEAIARLWEGVNTLIAAAPQP